MFVSIYSTISLILLLHTCSGIPCSQMYLPNQSLQTGTKSLAIFPQNQTPLIFRVLLDLLPPLTHLQMASSLSTFEGFNSYMTSVVHRKLRLSQQLDNQSTVKITFVFENIKWSAVKISYIFSLRDDMMVGTLSLDESQNSRLESIGQYGKIDYRPPVKLATGSYKIIGFISGFEVLYRNLLYFGITDIRYTQLESMPDWITVNFIISQVQQIFDLYFTYIVFKDEISYVTVLQSPTPLSGYYSVEGPILFEGQYLTYRKWILQRFVECSLPTCSKKCVLAQQCPGEIRIEDSIVCQ